VEGEKGCHSGRGTKGANQINMTQKWSRRVLPILDPGLEVGRAGKSCKWDRQDEGELKGGRKVSRVLTLLARSGKKLWRSWRLQISDTSTQSLHHGLSNWLFIGI